MDFTVKTSQLGSLSQCCGAGLTLFSGLSARNKVVNVLRRDPKVTTLPATDYCKTASCLHD